jgi:DNA polymerase I-like protein with 3'-5' exonuclease and polymerase domains
LENIYINDTDTLWDYYLAIEVPYTRVLYNMSRRGVAISTAYLKQIEKPAKKLIENALANIRLKTTPILGYEINLKSPDQLRELFYEKLHKIPTKWTKKKAESTDSKVLEGWADEGDELALEILEYKKLTKLYDTYVVGLAEAVDNKNRIHTTFNQHGTLTGRLSSVDPALQQIPGMDKDPLKLRRAFVAPPGRRLVVVDITQGELVILAHKSQDENMIKAIKEGKDLHMFATNLVFGYDYDHLMTVKSKNKKLGREALTDEEKLMIDYRAVMKTSWFLIIYGGGGKELASQLSLEFRKSDPNVREKQCEWCEDVFSLDTEVCTNCGPEETTLSKVYELSKRGNWYPTDRWAYKGKLKIVPRTISKYKAEEWMTQLLDAFPKVREYIERQHQLAERQQFVQTFLGRFRRLPHIKSSNDGERSKALRQSINIIQGDLADEIKIVQLIIENDPILKELTVEQLLAIHDELVLECPDDDDLVKKIEDRVIEIIEIELPKYTFELRTGPLKASKGNAYNWGDAK